MTRAAIRNSRKPGERWGRERRASAAPAARPARMLGALTLALLAVSLSPSQSWAEAASAPGAAAVHFTQAEAETLFQKATDACLHEDVQGCLDGYHQLLAAGFASANLYYNLGTILLRNGRLGPAILYLERALRLAPGDEDIATNLAQAGRMRVDRLVGEDNQEREAGPESLPAHIAHKTRADTWSLALLVLWLSGSALLLSRRLLRSTGARRALLCVGLGLMALALPAGAGLLAHVHAERSGKEAIVLSKVLPVREGPRQAARTDYEIHEGLKVLTFEREHGFQRIRLSNGLQGWVPAQGLARIEGHAAVRTSFLQGPDGT